MALYVNRQRAGIISIGRKRVSTLWRLTTTGLVKIYEGVRSCFGSGRWVGRKAWIGKEKWKNSK